MNASHVLLMIVGIITFGAIWVGVKYMPEAPQVTRATEIVTPYPTPVNPEALIYEDEVVGSSLEI